MVTLNYFVGFSPVLHVENGGAGAAVELFGGIKYPFNRSFSLQAEGGFIFQPPLVAGGHTQSAFGATSVAASLYFTQCNSLMCVSEFVGGGGIGSVGQQGVEGGMVFVAGLALSRSGGWDLGVKVMSGKDVVSGLFLQWYL